jgi:hypothetical protein
LHEPEKQFGESAAMMETAADIFRVTLLARQRQSLAAALCHEQIGNGCRAPLMRREDGLYAAVVFVSGGILRHLSFLADVQLAEACNLSTRLRAVPVEL